MSPIARLDALALGDLGAAHQRLAELATDVAGYLEGSSSPATRRAYRSDLAHFQLWAHRAGLSALPAAPDTVALYLADLAGAGAKASTIQRRVASISVAHQMAKAPDGSDFENPARSQLVRKTMAGIRRRLGIAPRQVTPLRVATLRKVLGALPEESLAAVRDRAVLLLGFATGCRRSEVAGLDVSDLRSTDDGLVVTIRRSKTDPEAAGIEVAVPRGRHVETCPVTAVLRWVTIAGLSDGPLFCPVDRWDQPRPGRLSPAGVAGILHRSLRAAGLDPSDYAGHSLRAGFATEAAAHGATERSIMAHGRWRSLQTVRRYIRSGELFADNAAAKLGL